MTDEAYIEWIRAKNSCLSGRRGDYVEELGDFRCEAAHVRRAGFSGTGYKEPYATVPLLHAEHHLQTVKGELAAIHRFRPDLKRTIKTSQEAKNWFDAQVQNYRIAWLKASGDKGVLEFIRDPQLMGQT